MMQLMRGMWGKLKAVAHTLPYDAAIMGDWQIPAARSPALRTPTLAMYGGKTRDALEARRRRAREGACRTFAEQVLPGQTHNVSAAVLVPALVDYFKE